MSDGKRTTPMRLQRAHCERVRRKRRIVQKCSSRRRRFKKRARYFSARAAPRFFFLSTPRRSLECALTASAVCARTYERRNERERATTIGAHFERMRLRVFIVSLHDCKCERAFAAIAAAAARRFRWPQNTRSSMDAAAVCFRGEPISARSRRLLQKSGSARVLSTGSRIAAQQKEHAADGGRRVNNREQKVNFCDRVAMLKPR